MITLIPPFCFVWMFLLLIFCTANILLTAKVIHLNENDIQRNDKKGFWVRTILFIWVIDVVAVAIANFTTFIVGITSPFFDSLYDKWGDNQGTFIQWAVWIAIFLILYIIFNGIPSVVLQNRILHTKKCSQLFLSYWIGSSLFLLLLSVLWCWIGRML